MMSESTGTPVYSANQAYDLDRAAISADGLADGELMLRAGAAAFRLLRFRWPRARRITIVCGAGNNGGDGYALACELIAIGLRPSVVQLDEPGTNAVDARRALARYREMGGEIVSFDDGLVIEANVIVDAILGIGSDRELDGHYLQAVKQVNRMQCPVLALDLPTGIDANTGRVPGEAIRATATISFIAIKKGSVTGPAVDYVGELYCADLSISDTARRQVAADTYLLGNNDCRGLCPQRRKGTHKNEQGRVLVVGGSRGMSGAALLAGEAALRSGAGLVRVASVDKIDDGIPELMIHRIEQNESLDQYVKRSNVLLIGPGLGQRQTARQVFSYLVDHRRPSRSLVIDADGLNCLASEPLAVDGAVLTPHPGEAARLLAITTADIENDRYAAASMIAKKYQAVCVLKGAGTVISDGNQNFICDRGNSSMATAGTGDVLAGVIASLLGQGLREINAARLGVYLHAQAGDAAAQELGNGLVAGDLIERLPRQLVRLCRYDDASAG